MSASNLSTSIKRITKVTKLGRFVKRLTSSAYRRESEVSDNIIQNIRSRGFEEIARRHANSTRTSRKYAILEEHVPEAVHNAAVLGLLNAQPMRIFDIGCGSGYFLYTLKKAGHDVLGMDLPDDPLYNDTVKFLELPRVDHRVERFQRLPDLGGPFDLITTFSVCFDLLGEREAWGPLEWKFFLDDCISRLKSGGRIFINFNPKTNLPFNFIPDEVANMLRQMAGATLTPNKEFFTLTI